MQIVFCSIITLTAISYSFSRDCCCSREKALIAIASGFRMPRHISIQLLINSSSKEIYVCFSKIFNILWRRVGLSFHSVASSNALDCLSASILIVPGVCAATTHWLHQLIFTTQDRWSVPSSMSWKFCRQKKPSRWKNKNTHTHTHTLLVFDIKIPYSADNIIAKMRFYAPILFK